jgi:hypothetical protein
MSIDFELLDAAIEDAAHPTSGVSHQQTDWLAPTRGTERAEQCGTAMCLAGFAAVRCGAKPPAPQRYFGGLWEFPDWRVNAETGEYSRRGGIHVAEFAATRLGLSEGQTTALFSGGNTLDEIRAMRDHLREHPDAGFEALFDAAGRTDW